MNNKKGKISLIIGIISIIVVFFVQIFAMPLALVGFIIGIKGLKEDKNRKLGLILNTVAFVIAVPLLFIYANVLNPIHGTWDCKGFNNGNVEEMDYVNTIYFSKSLNLKISKYGDDNNFVSGTYKFNLLNKTNSDGSARYYNIKMDINKSVTDGKESEENKKVEYEIALPKDKKEAVFLNLNNNTMYYCVKR